MHIENFDFDLPPELIAQEPPAERSASRLLVLDRATGAIRHCRFADLPLWLTAGDLLVLNDTRVFPARLLGYRLPGGGRVECLLLRAVAPDAWEALVHPGQRLRIGSRMVFEGAGRRLHGEILGLHFHGRRTVRLSAEGGGDSVDDVIEIIGHVPLPPYIKRPDTKADRERYQTIYARERGSVAAPTAGLHFTPALLEQLAAKGVEQTSVTLHVGYGTFQPIRVVQIEQHEMHRERYDVSPSAAEAISRALAEERRIVAVGTTAVRTLESLRVSEGRVDPAREDTDLFIRPGHEFRVVRGLITNFHLPRSSLLILVSAFAGRERVLAAYEEAVRQRYRFYSYGDAMLII